MRTVLYVPLISLSLLWATQASAGWSIFRNCASLLRNKVDFTQDEDGFVSANGVSVTGENLYTTPMILKNLDINETMVQTMAGKHLLSVGEGFSGLVPFLRQKGIYASALDLWYASKKIPPTFVGQQMREYIDTHNEYLISGSAFSIPVEDKTYDFVVSHMMVNNFDFETGLPFLKEAVRITKPGGEIRIFGYDERLLNRISQTFARYFKGQIIYTTELREFEYSVNESYHTRSDLLLTIRVME